MAAWRSDGKPRPPLPVFWVPYSFHPEDTLPSNLWLHAQSAYYLMHVVINKIAFASARKPQSVAHLKMEYLRRVMGTHKCDEILHLLMKNGDIRRESNYKPGQHSYGYLPGSQYEGQMLRAYHPTNPSLLSRLNGVQIRQTANAKQYHLPIHDYWEHCQSNLSVDLSSAHQLIAKLPIKSNRFGVQGMFVEQIANGERRFKVDKYGRVHNSITSIHKKLRHTLRIKGEPIAGVDIVNSQPALLALLISKKNFSSDLKATSKQGNQTTTVKGRPPATPLYDDKPFSPFEGFSAYAKAVIEGQLYEQLARETGLPRERIKTRLFSDVFGKKGSYWSEVETAFRKIFPGVWNFIQQFNRHDHAALLRKLQEVESNLVIQGVGGQLQALESDTCVSLHDGIYCPRSQLDVIQSAFEREFVAIGLQMKTAIKEGKGL